MYVTSLFPIMGLVIHLFFATLAFEGVGLLVVEGDALPEGEGLRGVEDLEDLVVEDLAAEKDDLVVEREGLEVVEREEDLKVAGVDGLGEGIVDVLGEEGIVVLEDLFILPLWVIGWRVANMRVASLTARMRRASCLWFVR